jgi:L-alanine-DL-glutamate epimerase-like enolase superfamily enzyme
MHPVRLRGAGGWACGGHPATRPAFCGGITEAMRIAALASSFNLRLAPHLWAGAPCFFAGLHVLAAAPAGYIVEFSLGANPMIHMLSRAPVVVRTG